MAIARAVVALFVSSPATEPVHFGFSRSKPPVSLPPPPLASCCTTGASTVDIPPGAIQKALTSLDKDKVGTCATDQTCIVLLPACCVRAVISVMSREP